MLDTTVPADLATPADHDPLDATFSSPRLELVPPDPSHYQTIRRAELSSPLAVRWRYRGATPSPEDFVRTLWTGVLAQFLVFPTAGTEPVGLVSCYDPDERSRFAYLAAAKFDPTDRSPLFFEGVVLFVNHVFLSWPFHKLYLDVPEFNVDLIQSGVGTTFQEEGRLLGHTYAAGRYWDQVTLALYRETWEEHAPTLLRFVQSGR